MDCRVPLVRISSILRIASKRQIRRVNRHPAKLRIQAREEINNPKPKIELQPLKYLPTYTPDQVSWNGWSPAPEKPLEGLPFVVKRTAKGLQLPVYRDYRNSNSVFTLLRRFQGNEEELKIEMSKICGGKQVFTRPGRLEVKGDHLNEVKQWLVGLGF